MPKLIQRAIFVILFLESTSFLSTCLLMLRARVRAQQRGSGREIAIEKEREREKEKENQCFVKLAIARVNQRCMHLSPSSTPLLNLRHDSRA
jgi:hypothetical protein